MENFRTRTLLYFNTFLISVALLAAGLRATLDFSKAYDFLSYHLPAALHMFGLTTYQLPLSLKQVVDGIPPLAEWIQGALVWSTGRMSLANSINFFAMALWVGTCSVFFKKRFSWRIFLTSLIAVPLLLFHVHSGYIDLWAGAFVAMAVVALLAAFEGREDWKTHVLLWLGVGIASYSKVQTWPLVAVIISAFAIGVLLQKEGRRSNRFFSLISLGLLSLLALGWAIRNFILLGNPTYPFQPPVIGGTWPGWPAHEYALALQTQGPSYLQKTPAPLKFLVSFFELGRLKGEMIWQADMWQSGESKNPNYRMGGWFFLTVLGYVFFSIRAWRLRSIPRGFLIFLVGLLATISVIPQSHELRYWMSVPLIFSFTTSLHMPLESLRVQSLALLYFSIAAVISLAGSDLLEWKWRNMTEVAPKEAVEFWKTQGSKVRSLGDQTHCLSQRIGKDQAIFWAGPDFNSFRVSYCQDSQSKSQSLEDETYQQ